MITKKLILFYLFFIFLNAEDLIESQAEVLFNYSNLQKSYKKTNKQVNFNQAVSLLEEKKYSKAIEIFKKTALDIKIPSFLNIGIAYYRMNQIYNAKIYFKRIYDDKESKYSNTYSYMSSCFYLYNLSKDKKYLDEIIGISKKHKNLSEHSKRMLADTYIVLKEYKKALKILSIMSFSKPLKQALLHIKLKQYDKAKILLENAKDKAFNQKKIDNILWFMIFRDLKSNDITTLLEHLDELNLRKYYFKTNKELPLRIYFNKFKYTPQQYLAVVNKFDKYRVKDFVFYFAPYIFSDYEELIYDISKGFIFHAKKNIKDLNKMVNYNSELLSVIKQDPIIRVKKLKELIKPNSKAYMYYNIGLSYAHIQDFHNSFKYFHQAYKLNPGNKLFSSMTLLSAQNISKKLKDIEYIEKNLKSNDGLYKYFGHKIYSMFMNKEFKVKEEINDYEKSTFYKSLVFLEKFQAKEDINNSLLLKDNYKDPLVYLIKLMIRKTNESDFEYFSRLQDNIPLKLNNNFLDGPLIITQYYTDILKALGLFYKADLTMTRNQSPSYLRTKALNDLHNKKPNSTILILELLQDKYNLEDKYTMYLIVAALLEANRYNDASVQISLIKAVLRDKGADFLSGVQLIQDLKIHSAKEYFNRPYNDSLIDFKLIGFDSFLEAL